MRPTRLHLGSALAVAVLGLATTSAYADDFGVVDAAPRPTVPGHTASLSTADCQGGGPAQVDAGSLGAGTLTLTPGADGGRLVGTLHVKRGVAPGTYGISGSCPDGTQLTGAVKVASGAKTGTGTRPDAADGAAPGPARHDGGNAGKAAGRNTGRHAGREKTAHADGGERSGPAVTTAPHAPTGPPRGMVHAGTGSTSDGSGSAEIAAGVGALLASGAGGIWMLRRRRTGERS
ncbi:hypothetical protein [Streptomyces pinistramenti]|uniref:hypothetical protein n=1 Tax=Streptomyces pinistramenti TaxID=2884812 RepID=UPI001D083F07|nr:hypothetical protein [Streptomyces pinistramenti]MCB5907281.1 hypothetical protein [Streptomyces pinistramenti]